MLMHDLFATDLLLEMAYTQKKAERIISGLEQPINDHLLKLWTIPDSPKRDAWEDDLVSWIAEIAEIVIRPANKRPAHIFYYKLLFFEPFGGGAEVPNILRRLRRLHRLGFEVQVEITADELMKRLRTLHRDLASLCAAKLIRENQIREFLASH